MELNAYMQGGSKLLGGGAFPKPGGPAQVSLQFGPPFFLHLFFYQEMDAVVQGGSKLLGGGTFPKPSGVAQVFGLCAGGKLCRSTAAELHVISLDHVSFQQLACEEPFRLELEVCQQLAWLQLLLACKADAKVCETIRCTVAACTVAACNGPPPPAAEILGPVAA